MRESNVWKRIQAQAPDWLKMERVEPMYPAGMSDVFWTDMREDGSADRVARWGLSGWLELKFCRPGDLSSGRIPKLRPEQPLFLRRQASNHVPCGILLLEEGGLVYPEKWYLWKARADHEWVAFINSKEALSAPTSTWAGKGFFYIEDVIRHLQAV